MINVTLDTNAGRSLMGIAIGVMTYQAKLQKSNLSLLRKETSTIMNLQKERDIWSDLSNNITTRMLDKRFKDPTFKRSMTDSDRSLQYVAKQNMLKARTRYDSSVSKYNQKKADMKVKSSFKMMDLKDIL